MSRNLLRVPFLLLLGGIAALVGFAPSANAQIPPPPATLTGSITDAAGPVPAGVLVEAFIDDTLCGTTETFYAGEGSARVTLYVIDVFADGQVKGCGKDDAAIRLRVGGADGRLAQKAVPWQAGLTRFNIVFGENVTPDPIPTSTPTPVRTATPTAPGSTAGSQQATTTPAGTRPPGTPVVETATSTPRDGVAGPTAAGPGNAGGGDGGGDGGFPVWGTVLLVVVGIAVIGAGVGFAMVRAQRGPGERPPAGS